MKGLDRVVILDFSKLMPGPFCTMHLADLGCRVIRVELPHWPDPTRSIGPHIGGLGFSYWMLNRNKESLCLDFRKPEGRKVLLELVARADVIVEGFRPGLMDKLGLGARELGRRFPRLIYCSISGYGEGGPWSRKAGHDLNFLAQSGVLGLGDSNGVYSFPAVQMADLSAAHYAASSILAALLHRAATKNGQRLSLSMTECAFTWQALSMGAYLATGQPGAPRMQWWTGRHPFYRIYCTRDGRRLAVGALERGFAVDLLRQIGRSDLESRLDGNVETDDVLARQLEMTFSHKTLAEWTALLDGKDVCVNGVLTLEEAMEHPHTQALGLLHARGPGKTPVVRSPVRFSRAPFRLRRDAPALGADNARVLRSLGVSSSRIRGLAARGVLQTTGKRNGVRP